MAKKLPAHARDVRDMGSIPDISWCVCVCVCGRTLPWPGGPRVSNFTWFPGLCAQLSTGVCLYLGASEDQGTCKGNALG